MHGARLWKNETNCKEVIVRTTDVAQLDNIQLGVGLFEQVLYILFFGTEHVHILINRSKWTRRRMHVSGEASHMYSRSNPSSVIVS